MSHPTQLQLKGLKILQYTPGVNLVIQRKPYIGSLSIIFAHTIILSFFTYHIFTNYNPLLLLPLTYYIWRSVNIFGGQQITINTHEIIWRRFWFPFIKKETKWQWAEIQSIYSTHIDPVGKRSFFHKCYRLIIKTAKNKDIIFHIRDIQDDVKNSQTLNTLLKDFKKHSNPTLKDTPLSLTRPFIILGIIFTVFAILITIAISFNTPT